MKIKFSNYLLVAVLQALLAVCRGIKMTKYINKQRKRAEKVRFTELKRRQHMSVILETKQLCKFYGAGENQVKAVKIGRAHV